MIITTKAFSGMLLLTLFLISASSSASEPIVGSPDGDETLEPIVTEETPVISTAPSDAPSLGFVRSDPPSDMPSDMPSKPPTCHYVEYHPPRSSTKSGKGGGEGRRRLVNEDDGCSEKIIDSGDNNNLSANLAATSSSLPTTANPMTAGMKVATCVVGYAAWVLIG